jgi:hypothetical protein
MLLKCGENCFIPAETINFLKFKMAAAGRRHLGFGKICIFDPRDGHWLLQV